MFTCHDFKCTHEKFIADDGKGEEHVEDAEEHGNGYTGGNGGESGTDGFCRFVRFLEGTGQHVHGVVFGGSSAIDVIVGGASSDEEDEGTGTKDGAEGVFFAIDAVDTKGMSLGGNSCTLLHLVDGGSLR